MTTTFRRADISLTESREEESTLEGVATVATTWTASFYGNLRISTPRSAGFGGPHVDMQRTGATPTEAEQNLIQAMAENGWEVR